MQRFLIVPTIGIACDQRKCEIVLCVNILGVCRFPPKLKREVWISLNAFAFEIKRADIIGGFGVSSIRKRAPDVQRLNKVLLLLSDHAVREGFIFGQRRCACSE